METAGAEVFVGLDWGEQKHVVRAVDQAGEELARAGFATDAGGLSALVEWVLAAAGGDAGRAVVGTERPDEPVVMALLSAGFRVGCLNPKQMERFRDRYSCAGAKDDDRDGLVLADTLRSDPRAYGEVRRDPAPVAELRGVTQLRQKLMVESLEVANQLRDQLRRHYPQALKLWVDNLPDEFACRLLEFAPTAEEGARLTVKRVENVRRRHHIHRLSASEVVAHLRAPGPALAPGTAAGAAAWVRALVPRWRLLREQMAAAEERINELLNQLCEEPDPAAEETAQVPLAGAHRVAVALCSLPFGGPVTRGGLVAEAWQALAESDLEWVRTHSGVAPVTRSSGRQRSVRMRRGCNRRLRYVVYHWARLAVASDPHWHEAYEALRRRGHRAGRAYRTIADRLLRVLLAMIRDGATYDPERLAHRLAPLAS